ncbi:VOC family protein [Catellatospora sp. KI3]|uniref:VOC family protein n=1 Tax=Catellatospora sp. KI3 TaxID=3041620 RepID=UPI00248324FA|nr:VOC family protein [Catellatospora sp. KI3]MDI1464045.1 VOC family protein [Catellatospora sp. KI3]
MDLKFEAVVIPVSDVDRAKAFYADTLGWREDIDYSAASYGEAIGFRNPGADSYRIIQLTPPGSACSIHIGKGVSRAEPGSFKNMHLVTSDLEATREDLVKRGVAVSEPFHFGPEGRTPGLEPSRADYSSYLTFDDPDGNTWVVQEIVKRLPGRE